MMKKINLLVFIFLLAFGLSANIYAQDKVEKKSEEKETIQSEENNDAAVDSKPFNAICPVSGEDIESDEFTFVHEGKTYAVCCKNCLKKIKKDPEKYTSRLSEDGKSLKKK